MGLMSYFEVVLEAIVCWVNHVKGVKGSGQNKEGNWKRRDILLLYNTALLLQHYIQESAFMQITWLNVYSIVGPCKQTKRDHLTAINNGGQHQLRQGEKLNKEGKYITKLFVFILQRNFFTCHVRCWYVKYNLASSTKIKPNQQYL